MHPATTHPRTGAAFFERDFWVPREKTVFDESIFLRTENAIQGTLVMDGSSL